MSAKLSFYQRGPTTLFASQVDQRFSYCLYVPESYDEQRATPYPLAVVVHGTGRQAQQYRDEFKNFCEDHDCILLAPLFPAGIGSPGELSNFKYIEYQGLRFDHLLLGIIDEVSETYWLAKDRFLLYGFSGGGHFAHRFFYLHPNRLMGVSVGAPGIVTLLDFDHDWWVGVRDIEERFGQPIDLAAMRDVPVQLVIGGEDTETWEIALTPASDLWRPGADLQGDNRLDRILALRRSLENEGITVRHDIVPGVGHDGHRVLEEVQAFFSDVLSGHVRAGTP